MGGGGNPSELKKLECGQSVKERKKKFELEVEGSETEKATRPKNKVKELMKNFEKDPQIRKEDNRKRKEREWQENVEKDKTWPEDRHTNGGILERYQRKKEVGGGSNGSSFETEERKKLKGENGYIIENEEEKLGVLASRLRTGGDKNKNKINGKLHCPKMNQTKLLRVKNHRSNSTAKHNAATDDLTPRRHRDCEGDI